MADEDHGPSHRPLPGADLIPRGYGLAIVFHPPIKLDRRRGCEFAAAISAYLEPRELRLEGNVWLISQQLGNSANGQFSIEVTETTLRFEIAFPTHSMEWIERHFEMVLKEFERQFKPKLVLSSSAVYRGTMDVDGDARMFLANQVMKFDPAKLGTLKRPVHLFGIRFFLPPFKLAVETNGRQKKSAKEKVTDWQADIKAESLIEDPTKLYLEADAQWPNSTDWKRDTIQQVIGHLAIVGEYLRSEVVQFLKKSSGEEEQ